ncbi:MAG: guanylate kinase [Ignavibacteria bacterium]|nr:guanylate kinase [Ignavibacteria bacterium]
MERKKQLIVLSAPSGAGKTTLARHLLDVFPNFKFSISATTRLPRENEINGKDYYFLTEEEFLKIISENGFIEYENIFGNYYGTLKSEVEKHLSNGEIVVFDIDVKGALSIKKLYPESSFLIFISPPSLQVLKERLIARKTETPEQLKRRFERIEMEMAIKDQFDYILVNDDLEKAKKELVNLVQKITQ